MLKESGGVMLFPTDKMWMLMEYMCRGVENVLNLPLRGIPTDPFIAKEVVMLYSFYRLINIMIEEKRYAILCSCSDRSLTKHIRELSFNAGKIMASSELNIAILKTIKSFALKPSFRRM